MQKKHLIVFVSQSEGKAKGKRRMGEGRATVVREI